MNILANLKKLGFKTDDFDPLDGTWTVHSKSDFLRIELELTIETNFHELGDGANFQIRGIKNREMHIKGTDGKWNKSEISMDELRMVNSLGELCFELETV